METTTTTTTTSTSSSASGSRRKRRYINISGDDIARAKAKVRRIKVQQWHQYLILKKFRKRRNAHK